MNPATIIRLAVLGAIWGGSFALQRIAVPVLGANLVAFGRLAFASVAMLGLVALLAKPLEWRKRWRDYLVLGALNSAVPFWLFAHAAPHLPSGYSAVCNATTPLFAVLLAWQAGTRPSNSKLGGVVLGMIGVALIAGFGAVTLSTPTALAFGGALLAGALYAVAALETRRRFNGSDPIVIAAGTLSASTLLLAPVAVIDLPTASYTWNAIGALLLIGLVCTALAYAIYFALLRDAGPERATTVTLLVPLFAMVWGALLVGESITLLDLFGASLVLFSVALVFEKLRWPARRRGPVLVPAAASSAQPKPSL
jgi:drug/metabolite transporter (DMT)-like permease